MTLKAYWSKEGPSAHARLGMLAHHAILITRTGNNYLVIILITMVQKMMVEINVEVIASIYLHKNKER